MPFNPKLFSTWDEEEEKRRREAAAAQTTGGGSTIARALQAGLSLTQKAAASAVQTTQTLKTRLPKQKSEVEQLREAAAQNGGGLHNNRQTTTTGTQSGGYVSPDFSKMTYNPYGFAEEGLYYRALVQGKEVDVSKLTQKDLEALNEDGKRYARLAQTNAEVLQQRLQNEVADEQKRQGKKSTDDVSSPEIDRLRKDLEEANTIQSYLNQEERKEYLLNLDEEATQKEMDDLWKANEYAVWRETNQKPEYADLTEAELYDKITALEGKKNRTEADDKLLADYRKAMQWSYGSGAAARSKWTGGEISQDVQRLAAQGSAATGERWTQLHQDIQDAKDVKYYTAGAEILDALKEEYGEEEFNRRMNWATSGGPAPIDYSDMGDYTAYATPEDFQNEGMQGMPSANEAGQVRYHAQQEAAYNANRADIEKQVKAKLKELGYSDKDWDFEKVLDFYKRQQQEKGMKENAAALQEAVKKHPAAAVAFSLAAPVLSLGSGIGSIDNLIQKIAHPDRPVNYYSYANAASIYHDAITGATSGEIQKAVKDATGSEGWAKAATFGYNTAESILDNGVRNLGVVAGIPPSLSLGIMASGAATSSMRQAHERGLTDEQALTLGVISGMTEYATEKIGLDEFLDTIDKAGKDRTFLQNLWRNMAAEGGEEGISGAVNLWADIAVSKDKSEWAQAIDAYRRQGYSDEAALALAFGDQAEEIGLEMLSGGLSGGIMGGSASVYNSVTAAQTQQMIDISGAAAALTERTGAVASTDNTAVQKAVDVLQTRKRGSADRAVNVIINNAEAQKALGLEFEPGTTINDKRIRIKEALTSLANAQSVQNAVAAADKLAALQQELSGVEELSTEQRQAYNDAVSALHEAVAQMDPETRKAAKALVRDTRQRMRAQARAEKQAGEMVKQAARGMTFSENATVQDAAVKVASGEKKAVSSAVSAVLKDAEAQQALGLEFSDGMSNTDKRTAINAALSKLIETTQTRTAEEVARQDEEVSTQAEVPSESAAVSAEEELGEVDERYLAEEAPTYEVVEAAVLEENPNATQEEIQAAYDADMAEYMARSSRQNADRRQGQRIWVANKNGKGGQVMTYAQFERAAQSQATKSGTQFAKSVIQASWDQAVVDTKAKVEEHEAKRKADLEDTVKRANETSVFKNMGYSVRVSYDDEEFKSENVRVNAFVNPGTKEIVFNGNVMESGGALLWYLGHEVTHKAAEVDRQLVDNIIKVFTELNKEGKLTGQLARMVSNMDTRIKQTQRLYQVHENERAKRENREAKTISEDAAKEEVAADLMRYAFQQTKLYQDIVGKDAGLAVKMRQAVSKMLKAMTGDGRKNSAVQKRLQEIADQLDEALEKAATANTRITDPGKADAAGNVEPGVKQPGALQFSISPYWERNYKSTFDSSFEKRSLAQADGEYVFLSGREVLAQLLEKNGVSFGVIDNVLAYMDKAADFMRDAGVTYRNIGLDDVNNAKIEVRMDDEGKPKSIVLSAMVKNGEYPVNFDLTQICKRREAMSKYVDKLLQDHPFNTFSLDQESLMRMQKILSEEGYDTACLGCFVEAKRFYMEEFVTKFVDKWNAAVRAINPDAEYFGFSDVNTKVTPKEITAADGVMEDWKRANEQTGNEKKERNQKAIERLKAEGITEAVIAELRASNKEGNRLLEIARRTDPSAKFKTDKYVSDSTIKNLDKGKLPTLDYVIKHIYSGAEANNTEKVENLISSDPVFQKLLRPDDLLTTHGLRKFTTLSGALPGLLAGSYGSGAPKLAQGFIPYNNEIAYLPDKASGKSLNDYLQGIAGLRSQSFSDFKIENVFDYLQMLADLTARGLPAHMYTKEIACAKILGMSGMKVNMSVMFTVEGEAYWGDEATARKYAGLRRDANGNLVYSFADQAAHDARLAETGEEIFVQSIAVAEAMALQKNPAYGKYIGIIGVGYSDEHIRMMLRDPNFRYVIPYHRSGLPVQISDLTNLDLATNYTDTQNTMKFTVLETVNGKKQAVDLRRLGVHFDTVEEFLQWVKDNGYELETSKAFGGHGKFDLYGDLARTRDPKQTAKNYQQWCWDQGYLPLFYQFMDEENYYKLLYDFSVTDENGNYAPQESVRLWNDEGEIVGMPKNAFAKNGLVDQEMAAQNERNAKLYAPENVERVEQRLYDSARYDNESGKQFSISEEQDTEYLELAKDPVKNAARLQEMVDEAAEAAGYTIKAYHGTTAEFTKFSRSGQGKNHDGYMEFGAGFYFTPSAKEAEQWVARGRSGRDNNADTKIMSVYLAANRILDADAEVPGGAEHLRMWLSKAEATFIAGRAYRYINYLIEDLHFTNTEAQEDLKALGVDAIKATYKNDTSGQYVVFDPEQIKSADPVTYDDKGKVIPLSERFNTKNEDIRFSISPEQDAEYAELVNQYEADTGYQKIYTEDRLMRLVKKAAEANGYTTPMLFHGTRSFGFTVFDTSGTKPYAQKGYIYASTKRQVAANYAGDNHYAGVRSIGTKYDGGSSAESIIKDAKSVYGTRYRKPTKEDIDNRIKKDYAEAQKVSEKLNELWSPLDNIPQEVANAVDWMTDIINTTVDNDLAWQVGADGIINGTNEEKVDLQKQLQHDFGRLEADRTLVRDYYGEHRSEMNDDQKKYFSYLMSYEFGDALIDIQYGLCQVLTPDNLLINGDGFADMTNLREAMDEIHSIGAYQLYGNLGDKPFVFDANGAQFWALKVPEVSDGYTDTDAVCKWAKENGYTSVVMKNIYDYGDKADNYVFFNSNQVKSADPVTYDDNGEVIPLSERFNTENDDIRYSLSQERDTEYLELAKDPVKNAARLQEMVDEAARAAGYDSPVLYHGTTAFGFTVFGDPKKVGFFFTDRLETASTYSGRESVNQISKKVRRDKAGNRRGNYSVYIKAKNLLTVDCKFRNWDDIAIPGNEIDRADGRFYGLEVTNDTRYGWSDYTTTDNIVAFAKEKGYDGVVFENLRDNSNQNPRYRSVVEGGKGEKLGVSTVYAVFDSEQIKSADPVTYDDNGNVIPLSERFNTDSEDVRYSISPEADQTDYDPNDDPVMQAFFDAYEEAQGEGQTEKDYPTLEQRLRAAERAQKKAEKALESEQAKRSLAEGRAQTLSKEANLAWTIYTKKRLREQRRMYQDKLNQARRDKLQAVEAAVRETRELERARADVRVDREREKADNRVKETRETWQRIGNERVEKAREQADKRVKETRETWQEQARKRLGIQKNAYEKKLTKAKDRAAHLRENLRLQSNAGKAALRNKTLNDKKRAENEEETSQAPIDTIRKMPDKQAALKRLNEAAHGLRTKGRKKYAQFVSKAAPLERFSGRQKSVVKADILATVYGGTDSTVENIFKEGLVNRSGDRIGDSFADVFLCTKNDKGKVIDENKQALLQDYMLHRHNIARMGIEAKAKANVEAFEEAHPELRDMSPRDFGLLLSLSDKEAEKAGKAEAKKLAKQYQSLISARLNNKNKAIFADEAGQAVTSETSREVVEKYERENPWLKEKADAIYKWWDLYMRTWVVGDLMSEEQYNYWKNLYPDYVPTYRVGKPGLGAGFGRNTIAPAKVDKRATGSFKEVVNIEDSFANLIQRHVNESRKNELLKNITDTAMMDNDGLFGDFAYFAWDEYAEQNDIPIDAISDLGVNLEEREKLGLEQVGKDYRITAMYNGVPASTYVSKEMYDSLSYVFGLVHDRLDTVARIGGMLTRPMKTAITGINPVFMLRNLMRDIPTAIINSQATSFFGVDYLYWWVRAWGNIALPVLHGAGSKQWQNYVALGGTNSMYYNQEGGFAKNFNMKPGAKGVLQRGWNGVKTAAGWMNETIEQVTRFAEYLATVKKYGDTYENRLRGIKNAAEVTVDFSRHGEYGQALNNWIPYWNPAVQGIDKVVRSVVQTQDGRSHFAQAARTLTRAALTTTLFEAVLHALLKNLGRDKDWEELDDRTKDTYYCIPLPGEHRFLKIPKNREWGAILGTPLMRILEGIDGREDPFKNYIETSLLPNFLPGMPLYLDENGKPKSDIIGFSQALDVAAGRDFANRRIVPYAYESGSKAGQYDGDTSVFSKWLSDAIGNKVGPMEVDFLLKDYFGDFGKLFVRGTSQARLSGEAEESVGDVLADLAWYTPWNVDSRASNHYTSDYYDLMTRLEQETKDMENHAVDDSYKQDPKYQAYGAMKKLYGKEISALNKQAAETLDREEKGRLKGEAVVLARAAMEFYEDCMNGSIPNPTAFATYADRPEELRDELVRLDGLAKDYAFEPSKSTGNTLVDTNSLKIGNSYTREYKLDDEAKAKRDELRDQTYNEQLSKVISSSAYRSASDTEKAEMLEAARQDAYDDASEDFMKWLQKNRNSTEKGDLPEAFTSLPKPTQKELSRLSGVSGTEKYNYTPAASTTKSYGDPDSKVGNRMTREYILDDAAIAQHNKKRNELYADYTGRVINSSAYRSASDARKAEMLAEARTAAYEDAKDWFMAWLKKNRKSTPKG